MSTQPTDQPTLPAHLMPDGALDEAQARAHARLSALQQAAAASHLRLDGYEAQVLGALWAELSARVARHDLEGARMAADNIAHHDEAQGALAHERLNQTIQALLTTSASLTMDAWRPYEVERFDGTSSPPEVRWVLYVGPLVLRVRPLHEALYVWSVSAEDGAACVELQNNYTRGVEAAKAAAISSARTSMLKVLGVVGALPDRR